jgi:hypothetical protein
VNKCDELINDASALTSGLDGDGAWETFGLCTPLLSELWFSGVAILFHLVVAPTTLKQTIGSEKEEDKMLMGKGYSANFAVWRENKLVDFEIYTTFVLSTRDC